MPLLEILPVQRVQQPPQLLCLPGLRIIAEPVLDLPGEIEQAVLARKIIEPCRLDHLLISKRGQRLAGFLIRA
ncbi:hypothetical protein D3C73_1341620 [compost metagenome]